MQAQLYEAIRQQEEVNWWFIGRRRLIRDFLLRDPAWRASESPRILELGCGTGGMVEVLQPHGMVVGADLSPVALALCHGRGLKRVFFGDGRQLPFRDASFTAISSMDVIEHIDEDLAVLRECYRACAPGGVMLITVPALRWLWTSRDVRLEHKRRYHRGELLALAQEAGFVVEKCSYYTLCMFPAFAVVVLYHRLRGRFPNVTQDVPAPPRLLNWLFLRLLLVEQWLMRWVNYPVGVSLFCVLRKPPVATA